MDDEEYLPQQLMMAEKCPTTFRMPLTKAARNQLMENVLRGATGDQRQPGSRLE